MREKGAHANGDGKDAPFLTLRYYEVRKIGTSLGTAKYNYHVIRIIVERTGKLTVT